MSIPSRAGDPIPARDPATRISAITLQTLPIDLIVQWQRCSIIADFFASYLAYHFENRSSATHAVSSGLNELVENIAKFSADKQQPVRVVVTHFGDHLRVETHNEALRPQAEALARRLDRMTTVDAEELFVEQLEHTASADRAASGLGLIALKKDYRAAIGATLTPLTAAEERFAIVVTVELDVESIEQS